MAMKVGLLQINNELPGRAYHPYAVGSLEAYALAHLKDPFAYEFFIPVFERTPVREAVMRLINADLVAFSSYVWNEQLQLEIARTLKKLRPSTGIVFGGPQVPPPFEEENPGNPSRAKAYLEQNPFIDILCHGEGEELFTELLEHWHDDWDKIPSVTFKHGTNFRETLKKAMIADYGDFPSPYLTGMFDSLMEEYPNMQWNGLFETNRHCPYGCTFCDWGTRKKPIRFPIERVFAELKWFGEHQVWRIWCCDANFGIFFPRDLEIVQHAVKIKEEYGRPEIFYVQSAKRFADRMYEIHATLHKAKMEQLITLALQSTDDETLKSVDRKNIRPEYYKEIQARANRDGIPTSTDLIVPLPGETFESFVNGTCEVIESGGMVQINPLSIEPNAPMANPIYLKQFGIACVEARVMNLHGAVTGEGISHVNVTPLPRENFSSDEEWLKIAIRETDKELYEKQLLVIATASMPKEDLVRAKIFSWMALLLYFNRLLIVPLVVLNKAFGLHYQELFTFFSDHVLDTSVYPILSRIQRLFRKKAQEIQKGGYELCAFNGIWWPANEYAMVLLVKQKKLAAFYKEANRLLDSFLQEHKIDIPSQLLEEALLLNRELLKLPDRRNNLDIYTSYNIGGFFNAALNSENVPFEKKKSHYYADRMSTRWDFDNWCKEVVWLAHKGSLYMHEFQEVNYV